MSSYLNWHVGMKVVCVDASGASQLEKNRVYEIQAMQVAFGSVYIGLVGVKNGNYSCGAGWLARRFRPVQIRKTDISIFTAMLHGTDRAVDA